MKLKLWFILPLVGQLIFSCKKELEQAKTLATGDGKSVNLTNASHSTTIAIVSDIHYMDPSLLRNNGAAGIAFQNYLDQDPKLVQYSDKIWRNVWMDVRKEKPDILLLPGDITKDGEKISHEAMARSLDQLRSEGIQVFVIPGNHDINNAKAKVFDGNNAYPVAITSKSDFESIYGNFGYNQAIAKDANSLSYVVQPTDNLRIIGIDASRYEEFGPEGDIAAGRIKPTTLSWILEQLAKARQDHVSIFAMMHHNLIEHYTGQSQLDPGYVIDDWEHVTNTLMEAGLQVIFTGHYHANDISAYVHNGKTLFDIQTGSLVTAPSPYRFITLKENKLAVTTKTVQAIKADLPGGLDFPAYSNLFLSQHLDGYFNYYLANQLGAPQQLATEAAPLFRNGIMAHFAGDEKMPPDQRKKIEQLATMSQQLAGIVTTLWTDTGEKDNKNNIEYR